MNWIFILLSALLIRENQLVLSRGCALDIEQQYYVLTLYLRDEYMMLTDKPYLTEEEQKRLFILLKSTPWDLLMKERSAAEFWDKYPSPYKASYIVGKGNILGSNAPQDITAKKIVVEQVNSREAKVSIEYSENTLFRLSQFSGGYSHVFYLHFTQPQEGIADVLQILPFGGNFIFFSRYVPFTLHALPQGFDVTIKSEEQKDNDDIARC